MNKLDLIAAVAEHTELPKAKATEVVDAVFSVIEGALKKKDEVRLVGVQQLQRVLLQVDVRVVALADVEGAGVAVGAGGSFDLADDLEEG